MPPDQGFPAVHVRPVSSSVGPCRPVRGHSVDTPDPDRDVQGLPRTAGSPTSRPGTEGSQGSEECSHWLLSMMRQALVGAPARSLFCATSSGRLAATVRTLDAMGGPSVDQPPGANSCRRAVRCGDNDALRMPTASTYTGNLTPLSSMVSAAAVRPPPHGIDDFGLQCAHDGGASTVSSCLDSTPASRPGPVTTTGGWSPTGRPTRLSFHGNSRGL